MSGDSVTNSKTKGSFEVITNNKDGVPFKNETNQEVQVSFQASGQWSPGPNYSGNVGPNGDQNMERQELMTYSDYTAFCLLALNKDWGSTYQVGVQSELSVPANGTLWFLVNDRPEFYSDNNGSLTVSWNKK